MTALVQIALGSVLLLAGRRLYWLLAGTAGPVLGLFLTQQLFSDVSQTVLRRWRWACCLPCWRWWGSVSSSAWWASWPAVSG